MKRTLFKPILTIQGQEIPLKSERELTGLSTAQIVCNAYNATQINDEDKIVHDYMHDRTHLLCVAWYSKLDN